MSCVPGNVVWQRRYDSGQDDMARAIAFDGKAVVVGGIWRSVQEDGVAVDWQIIRYDSRGNLIWRRLFDSGNADWLADLMIDSAGDIVAVGSVQDSDTDTTRILLARFRSSGLLVWYQTYALGLVTQGSAICPGPGRDIIVCGTVFSGASASDDDILLVRFDSSGSLIDWETLNFGADENGHDIKPDGQGGYALVGSQIPGPTADESISTSDILVVRGQGDFRPLWRRVYDSGADDIAGSVVLGDRNDIYVAVTTRPDDNTSVRLLGYSQDGSLEVDRRYRGRANAACLALTRGKSGEVLGAGAAGPDDRQQYIGLRYRKGQFASFLAPVLHRPWVNELAYDLAADTLGNVYLTGVSDPGPDSDILTVKVQLFRPGK